MNLIDKLREDEFKFSANMDGFGLFGWPWTLAALIIILVCRFLSFRRPPPPPKVSPFPASASLRSAEVISDSDLKNLLDNLDEKNSSGGEIWENVVDRSRNSVSYKAKCCKPKDGVAPLKYVSITTFEDCSMDVLLDFYMDNEYRMHWDKTVVQHQQLQLDQTSATEFGRTVKKFPFLTPREYVLAWKLWRGTDGSFYCFNKECEHPLAPKDRRYVRVSVYRSGWRIKKVPGRNACEIRMVHQENAGLKSTTDARLSVQKIPAELEVREDSMSTIDQENEVVIANQQLEACRSNKMPLRRIPSSKVIANGLVLLGGAIFLSRGYSSLGSKVTMAYLLSKLTKRGASFQKQGKFSTREDSFS